LCPYLSIDNPKLVNTMKIVSKLLGVATLVAVTLSAQTASANIIKNAYPKYSVVSSGPGDTLNVAKKLRVVFIPNSTYKNFKIGIESAQKTDVNIQVLNSKGMVVFSELKENVFKKLEEMNFSFLKKGEYTVKVSSQDDVYTKTMIVP
jgi:hypothetical protein